MEAPARRVQVICNKIYPGVTRADQIPKKDIIMVMDCDHMCKPETFNMMGPCMRDLNTGVTLLPQWFHNLVYPGAQTSTASTSYSAASGACARGCNWRKPRYHGKY
jgi:cellulose synthase/poly-beta-1,6-N-acetylglucosamine synthase-like glycosyltransferase